MTLSQVVSCLNLPAPETTALITGASIDSRTVRPGDIFICLPGERVDGHDFAFKAANAGAVAILANRPLMNPGIPVLVVPDTERALGDLARCWRSHTTARVICVTGTSGKTTLMAALAAILKQAGSVTSTQGNRNNQIGLPLTILNANSDDCFWLLEAGISKPGDMEYLANITKPDLAVIINVGAGHTEGLGERGTAWHKTRLLASLSSEGQALINADYPDLLAETRELGVPFLCFSVHNNECPYRLLHQEGGEYTLDIMGQQATFSTSLKARFNRETVLAAVAAAHILGLGLDQIQAGLTEVSLPKQRYNHLTAGSSYLIDDTYNANPLSMHTALAEAAAEAQGRHLPLILVLGEMAELGDLAQACHTSLGEQIASLSPAAIFWKGRFGKEVTAGCRQSLIPLGNPEDFVAQWNDAGLPDAALVLFKGSRCNKLEQYVESFIQSRNSGDTGNVL